MFCLDVNPLLTVGRVGGAPTDPVRSSNRTCGFPTSGSPTIVAPLGARVVTILVSSMGGSRWPVRAVAVARPCGPSCLARDHLRVRTYRSDGPSPSRPVLLSGAVLRYYACLRLPVPPSGEGLAVVALLCFFDHRTRQGLTGSVAVFSLGAIRNHPPGSAAVLLVPCAPSGSACPFNRRSGRLHPKAEGSSPKEGHHRFTEITAPRFASVE